MKVREQLALQCVLMSLQNRVLPKKDENAVQFAHRLHAMGSVILDEMLTDAKVLDDEGGGSPIYTGADEQTQEFEPEQTLTESGQIRYYIDEDGAEDWYDYSAPSVKLMPVHACPKCQKTCSEADVDAVFGFRNIKYVTSDGEVTVVRRQSWCRACRIAALRQKQATRVEVPQELQKDCDLPAAMTVEDCAQMSRHMSRGRASYVAWIYMTMLSNKHGRILWSKNPKKLD